MIHYNVNRFARVSILHPSTNERGYTRNVFFVSGGGQLIESHATQGKAEHWARYCADRLRQWGLSGPQRRVWRFVDGVGFVLLSEH